MSSQIINQILSRLKSFAWKSPKERTSAYLISLNEVVIYETLVDIFDCLKD